MSAIFTSCRPDPASIVLKTGWLRYNSRQGIDGLVRFKKYDCELLFVGASNPGTGQFRRFIDALKLKYDSVTIFAVWNEKLPEILLRYGFKEWSGVEPDGEVVSGYRWVSSPEEQDRSSPT